MQRVLDAEARRLLWERQVDEITEHYIYAGLARWARSPENRRVLERIAADERRHADYWAAYTGHPARPNWLRVGLYLAVGRLLGFTFTIKWMERGERRSHAQYERIRELLPEAEAVIREELEHEDALIAMLDEERLRYIGSIVLGLNDALVELTGALAGLTLALQNTRLIAVSGLITGIAAALSMAASEYLSTRAEGGRREPLKAALYTGLAYILTVFVLVLPYLIFENYFVCLAATLAGAVAIIGLFNYYVAVAQDVPFRSRFLEMMALSFGVAAISFGLGLLLRSLFGIEI